MARPDYEHCFYCGGLVTKDAIGDHFPLPKSFGGSATVPCCVSCHDMKDRFSLESWPVTWIEKVMEDFPKMSRETRIFLAKAMRLFADYLKMKGKSDHSGDHAERNFITS